MLWRTNSSLATASNRARDDASNPITRKPTSGANVLGRRGAVGVRVGDVARLARHRTGLPRRQALVPETMRDGEERAGGGLRTARSACGVSLRLGTRRAYPGLRCLAQTRLFPGRRIRRSGQRCHGILAQRLSGSSNGMSKFDRHRCCHRLFDEYALKWRRTRTRSAAATVCSLIYGRLSSVGRQAV
ncbi:hypothetical protein ACVJBD_007259 [Rhizobium mongolense]